MSYALYEVKIEGAGGNYTLRCSHKLLPFRASRFAVTPEDTAVEAYVNADGAFGLTHGSACKEVKDGILGFYKTLDATGISYSQSSFTCGSIALKHYTTKYNQIEMALPRKITNVLKQAYHGGRCEIFGNAREGEKVLHFDFRGMYQSCMTTSLPYGSFTYQNAGLDPKVPGFYYGEFECLDNLPLLPMRESKLVFKAGRVRGWFWHEEILAALSMSKTGKPVLMHGLISDRNGEVLAGFVSDINKIREQGNMRKDIGKLLINSFYGRLGLDESLDLLRLSDSPRGSDTYGKCGELFIIKERIKSKPKSNVAVAAAITAKARIKLYEALVDVREAGGRVLYCDTDSVFACFPADANVEDRRLGKHVYFDTRLHDTIITDSVFVSPKTYGVCLRGGAEVVKIKGVNVGCLSLNELKAKFYSRDPYVRLPYRSVATRNLEVTVCLSHKDIRLDSYDKRLWSDDLKSTSPYTNA